ncbi:hypothetical protein [Microbispora sp. ATCC PTA-5024]|uniref:hypothetical protein n=1 Tax=Microbispora sp. ATCC PTA-5024 TaxID=316330 RepID=UPI0003DCC2A3|nr:hypothetical protein [Microbispora sp. ATCC PTA-5024]ETK30405.1 hypothetical protein MPTA5024_40330 [Microbispora sp. ATCC PTA-5024]
MSGTGDLERRYRRLIGWYPREFRRAHEDEMLTLLLETAEDGRTGPTFRETADLVLGAVRVRLRHAFGPRSVPHWRRAVDLSAAVAPLLVLVPALGTAVAVAEVEIASEEPLSPLKWLALPGAGLLLLLLAWSGRRRTAAAWAWALTVAEALSMARHALLGGLQGLPTSFPLVATATAALLLTFAGDLRGGARALRRRRAVPWAVLGVLVQPPLVMTLTRQAALWDVAALPLLAAAAGVAARSPVGRRALVLLSPMVSATYGLRTVSSLMLHGTPLVPAVAGALSAGVGLAVALRGRGPAGDAVRG